MNQAETSATTPVTPAAAPAPAYHLLPDESPDILVDVADLIAEPDGWLDAPNSIFAGNAPRSLIGTEREWLLRNVLRMAKYGLFS